MFNAIFSWIQRFFSELRPYVIVSPWQQAIRVRLGKYVKLLHPGVHLRIPFLDTIFRQAIRLRIKQCDRQTVTTTDHKAVTVEVMAGFAIADLERLYNTLHSVDSTIMNYVQGQVSQYIATTSSDDCTPDRLAKFVMNAVRSKMCSYGVDIQSVAVNFFIITEGKARTFRLVGDQSPNYAYSGIDLDEPVSYKGGYGVPGPGY